MSSSYERPRVYRPLVGQERYDAVVAERDHWIRLFNRLEAAVTHHQKNTGAWFDEADEALWVARSKILKAAQERP